MAKVIVSFLFLFIGFQAFANNTSGDSSWKIVPNKEVCMVTNMHFARPQIPVEQGGKTYYGCCENCKATIQTDASSRAALDPVSKKSVDKARATIAANSAGAVLYFENKTNFDRYMAQQSKPKK